MKQTTLHPIKQNFNHAGSLTDIKMQESPNYELNVCKTKERRLIHTNQPSYTLGKSIKFYIVDFVLQVGNFMNKDYSRHILQLPVIK